MPAKTKRRIGFSLMWVILFTIVFAIQTGHQHELDRRAVWMIDVNQRLESHDTKLDEMTAILSELPDEMIRRFLELPK